MIAKRAWKSWTHFSFLLICISLSRRPSATFALVVDVSHISVSSYLASSGIMTSQKEEKSAERTCKHDATAKAERKPALLMHTLKANDNSRLFHY